MAPSTARLNEKLCCNTVLVQWSVGNEQSTARRAIVLRLPQVESPLFFQPQEMVISPMRR